MSKLWPLFLPAVGYQLLAITAALLQLKKRSHSYPRPASFLPPVSVLKPVSGLDPNTAEAFLSQTIQDYPSFEILFGVQSETDEAVTAVRQLQNACPALPIRLIIGRQTAPNPKVGVLMELAKHANHPVWVLNDGDIRVTPDYLATIVQPLSDRSVGVVTCPYRAQPHSMATAWEALGIATDFMPSAFVAQLLGVREFGFGSTLAFRADDLIAAGGFAAFAEYLADDYQLAKRIASLGKRTVLSSYVVETSLGEESWSGVWRHQLRWARTIKASKGSGYAGLPITQAGLWIFLALALGVWPLAVGLLGLRLVSALTVGILVLESRPIARWGWSAPLWDCYAFGVWVAAYLSNQVKWRNRVLTIGRGGIIQG